VIRVEYECPRCGALVLHTGSPAVLFVCGWYGVRHETCGEAICVAEFVQCRSRFRLEDVVHYCSKEKGHANEDHLADDWCGTGWTTNEEMEGE